VGAFWSVFNRERINFALKNRQFRIKRFNNKFNTLLELKIAPES